MRKSALLIGIFVLTIFIGKAQIKGSKELNAQALYIHCANAVSFTNSSGKALVIKSHQITGGEILENKETGAMAIVPNAAMVHVILTLQNGTLQHETFQVKQIPQPTVLLNANNRRVDFKRGIQPKLGDFMIRMMPDEEFKTTVPKDARYKVQEVELILIRDKNIVKKQMSNTSKLERFHTLEQKGDIYVIKINKILRRTYKNTIELIELAYGTPIIMTVPVK